MRLQVCCFCPDLPLLLKGLFLISFQSKKGLFDCMTLSFSAVPDPRYTGRPKKVLSEKNSKSRSPAEQPLYLEQGSVWLDHASTSSAASSSHSSPPFAFAPVNPLQECVLSTLAEPFMDATIEGKKSSSGRVLLTRTPLSLSDLAFSLMNLLLQPPQDQQPAPTFRSPLLSHVAHIARLYRWKPGTPPPARPYPLPREEQSRMLRELPLILVKHALTFDAPGPQQLVDVERYKSLLTGDHPDLTRDRPPLRNPLLGLDPQLLMDILGGFFRTNGVSILYSDRLLYEDMRNGVADEALLSVIVGLRIMYRPEEVPTVTDPPQVFFDYAKCAIV